MTTQLQQCREVAAALDEEVTEWRRKDAGWREHRNAAEKALHDMPFVMDNYRAALARAEAAEQRVAELEAQLEEATQLLSIAIDRLPEEEQEIVALRWALSGTFTNELPTIAAPAPQEPTP